MRKESKYTPPELEKRISRNVQKLMNLKGHRVTDLTILVMHKTREEKPNVLAKLASYLKNEVRWRSDYLLAIAEVYKVSLDYIFGNNVSESKVQLENAELRFMKKKFERVCELVERINGEISSSK